MAVYVDVRRGSMVLSGLYCRIKMIGGAKASAHYQIEICTDQNGPSLPVLDVSQVYYMFGESNEAAGYQGAPFDVTAAPWVQAYADLKLRFSKGLLTWCVAMREEGQGAAIPVAPAAPLMPADLAAFALPDESLADLKVRLLTELTRLRSMAVGRLDMTDAERAMLTTLEGQVAQQWFSS